MICLTFDVEERFHSHLTIADGQRQWSAGDSIKRLVDLLEEQGRTATFFIVGELAEHYPTLIRRIGDAGFEIASHSYSHLKMDAANRRACEADITRSKQVLEDISGRSIIGYRAPSWTAQWTDAWLWDHLAVLGFRYDSSLFPFRTQLYGSFSNSVYPSRLRPDLLEIPPTVATFGPLRIPFGGGFYLRLHPMWTTRWLLRRDLARGQSPIVYVHPWELDIQQSRPIESGWLNRFIGNYNADQTWPRLTELVRDYPSQTMANLCQEIEVNEHAASRNVPRQVRTKSRSD